LSRWFPDEERGRAQGALLAASSIGGAVAPYLATVMIHAIGWRWTFVVFGGIGAVWALGFWLWFRDDPLRACENNLNRGENDRQVLNPLL
jgi:MFS transporter, ACS family, glucarate transporter